MGLNVGGIDVQTDERLRKQRQLNVQEQNALTQDQLYQAALWFSAHKAKCRCRYGSFCKRAASISVWPWIKPRTDGPKRQTSSINSLMQVCR
jgi:hypothetical protein